MTATEEVFKKLYPHKPGILESFEKDYELVTVSIVQLPTGNQVSEWYSDNIDTDCSASSAIYKFRQWLAFCNKSESIDPICPVCNGTGMNIDENYFSCQQCYGTGYLNRVKTNSIIDAERPNAD